MVDGIIEFVAAQFRQLLNAGSDTALQMVLEALQSQPTPTLTEDLFQSLYGRVWGFAVLASLITGLFGVLLSSTTRQRGMTLWQSLLYFLRVYGLAMLLPLAVFLGIYMGDLLVDAALRVAPEEFTTNGMVNLPGPVGIADELLATLIAFGNWLLAWTLAILVLLLTWGILPLMAVAVAMSPLAPVGRDPGQFMRRSYTWIAVAITAKVLIAIVLAIGVTFLSLINELGIELLNQVFQLATMTAAIWWTLGLKSKIEERDLIGVWIPSTINARVTGGGDRQPSVMAKTLRTGVQSGREQYKSQAPKQPARIRRALEAGLSAGAASPDPRIRYASTFGALLAGKSANKAEEKAEGNNQ